MDIPTEVCNIIYIKITTYLFILYSAILRLPDPENTENIARKKKVCI